MIVDLNPKLDKELMRLVFNFLNGRPWSDLKELMKGDVKKGLVILCMEEVYVEIPKWHRNRRKYEGDVETLFQDPDDTMMFMEEKIDHAYTVLCARKQDKYKKDREAKARKRAEVKALKELASRDSADAPAAGAPEGPAAGAPEHKAPWKTPRKALRQGAPRALPEAVAKKKRKLVVSDDEEAPSPANAAGALEPPEDPKAAAKREAKRIRDKASKKRRTELALLFNPVVRKVATNLMQDPDLKDGVTFFELYNKASEYVFEDEKIQIEYNQWLSSHFPKCVLAFVNPEWLDARFPLPKPAPAAVGPGTSCYVAMAERPVTPVTPGRATARSSPAPRDIPDSPRTPVTTPVTPGRAVPRDSPAPAPAPAADAAADAAFELLLAELEGGASAEVLEILRGEAAPAALAAPVAPAPVAPAAPAAGGVGFLAAPPPVIDHSSLDYCP